MCHLVKMPLKIILKEDLFTRITRYLGVAVQRCLFERLSYHRPDDLERAPQVGSVRRRSFDGRQLGHVLRPAQHELENREVEMYVSKLMMH